MELPFLEKPAKKEKKEEGLFFEVLLEQLDRHQRRVLRQFKKHFAKLLSWMEEHGYTLEELRVKTVRVTATTALTTSLLLATLSPYPKILAEKPSQEVVRVLPKQDLLSRIKDTLSKFKENPSEQTGQDLANLIASATDFPAKIVLEGHKLERNVGLIGAEQHLYRYPGDNLAEQLQTEEERKMYWASGIAPGLGAWGYFTPSKQALTRDLVEKEKYYLTIQTFLVSDWNRDWPRLKDWYKYRKMLVYNPKTGQAVVAVVADAGPATWTGKHFGGSPEVMHYLGLGGGPRKGEVIVLFLDDPDDRIPLGAVEIKLTTLALKEVK